MNGHLFRYIVILFIPPLLNITNLRTKYFILSKVYTDEGDITSIFHRCTVWIEKYVTRVTDKNFQSR